MIVVLKPGTDHEEVEEVVAVLAKKGIETRVVSAGGKPVVHLLSGSTRGARRLLKLDQVEAIVPTSGPRLRAKGRPFYPYYVVHLAATAVLVLGALIVLAGHFPPGLGDVIDPHRAPEALEYPWYVRAPLSFVALFPPDLAWLAWLCLYAMVFGVFLLPVLDRSRTEEPRRRWPLAAAALFVAGWFVLTFAGLVR